MIASYILQDRAKSKMTSSQNVKVDDNFVQPAATRVDARASKDEQIKALISSVQDLKQQLASTQQHLTANEITIKDMSARFKTLEDGLDVTRSELNATTITGRQMKDELAEQSEEQFKAFEKLLSSSSHGLNEELITNIPAIVTNMQNSEKIKNILEEVTMIKEELAQEVIATQQNLESTTQMFEKEFTTIKEEIQACCSEAKKAEDNYAQSLTSIQAKLTASQVVGQHEEGKASRKLTQQIENLKRNLTEHFNQKFTCTEGDVTEFREEMKKLHEELEVVKQENSLQAAALATSHNKMKRNLILFVVIVIFSGVLVAFFSPYSMVYDVNQTTLNIVNDLRAYYNYNNVTMRTYWSLTVDQLKNDQESHLQRLDDIERDVNVTILFMQTESKAVELVAELHENISAVNKTALRILDDLIAHYDHEIIEMRNLVTELPSNVDTLNRDQVLQLQKLAGIEKDLNITRSHDAQDEIKIAELVSELHKNISAVNETTLKVMNDVKAFYGHENMRMRNLIKDWSLKVNILRNDQVLHSQRLHDVEGDINVTKSNVQTEGDHELVELVAKLHNNISAVNKTALDSISELKTQQIHLHCFSGYPQYRKELIGKAERSLTDHSSPVIVKISGISRMIKSFTGIRSLFWANNSFNIKGETIMFTVRQGKGNLDNMRIVYSVPHSIKIDKLILMNQLKDSNHYIISRNLTDSPSPAAMYIGRWKYEYPVEQLLKLTPTCQYVVYDSLFLSVDYHINNEEGAKRRYDNTEQCIEHWFKSSFFPGVSCEDIYNKNPESHQCSGYYWIVKNSKVFCGMTYTGSSCEHIYNKYPEIYKNNSKEKSGYYRLNNKHWTYCNMTEIAANDDFTSTCAAVEVIKSTYQSFLPGESCESIYNNNAESHEWSGYYWNTSTSSRVYCRMNYTGSSCEDIYNNNPETVDKSGYYRINDSQWTYCNMTEIVIASGDFISTCAGVGGGWRRIVNIDISAGDDCPGEWRKATQSGISFCRVASDGSETCSSASFSTNGTSYQRVCGRARGYQKGDTVAFYGSQSAYDKTIDQSYVSGLSITYSSNPRQHIRTFAVGRGETFNTPWNCPCSVYGGHSPSSFVGNDYYCESGSVYNQPDYGTYYFNDILWDGAGCVDNCCDNTTQPWFYHRLNQTTQDDIEARICD